MTKASTSTVVGRYVLHAPIARGGMATIHLARLLGAEGFSRMVAAKRLHPQLTDDAEFLAMFLDEARIASKVHHPNVVPVLDVVQTGGEVILVQEYVHGLPLDKLLRAGVHEETLLPVGVAVAIGADMLAGLAAAHDAKDELGTPLGVVHRDVSPQNVIVGVDGIARLLDFGVAKANLNRHVTQAGTFKGKLAYTAPEQLRGVSTPAIDLYAASVVIWEALAGRRLYPGLHDAELVAAVQAGVIPRLLDVVDPADIPPERWAALVRLDAVVRKGMAFEAEERWATAAEMGEALVAAVPPATAAEVSRCVKRLGKEYLEGREKLIVTEESSWRQRASAAPGGRSEPSETGATLRPSEIPALPPPPSPHRRLEWPVVAALLLLGGLLTGVLVLLLRPRVDASPAAAAAPSGYEAEATQKPLAADAAPAPPASAEPRREATAPSPSTSASAPSPPASAAPAVEARPARLVRAFTAPRAVPVPPAVPPTPPAPRPAPPPAAPPADCNPPFYFDGKKKVFKPGCL